MANKIIGDVVHGYVEIYPHELSILHSPYFQRLRYLKQNGTAFLVYPNLQTSRFEHSLGVGQVATHFFDDGLCATPDDVFQDFLEDSDYFLNAYVRSPNNLDIKRSLRFLLRAAALLHDVGHLPLSHTAEAAIHTTDWAESLPAGFRVAKPHELLGLEIVRQEESLFRSEDEWLRRGVFLILACYNPDFLETLKRYDSRAGHVVQVLKEIISGEIDCDRGDYILRDLRASGRYFGEYDLRRLSQSMRVVRDGHSYRLALDIRGLRSVEQNLFSRYQLYKTVIWHHKVLFFDELAKRLVRGLLEAGRWQQPLFEVYEPATKAGAHFREICDELKSGGRRWRSVPFASWQCDLADYRKLAAANLVRGEAHSSGPTPLRLCAFECDPATKSLDDVWLLGELRDWVSSDAPERFRTYCRCLLGRKAMGLSLWKDFPQFDRFRGRLGDSIEDCRELYRVELHGKCAGKVLFDNCVQILRARTSRRRIVYEFWARLESRVENRIETVLNRTTFVLLHLTSVQGFGDLSSVAISDRKGEPFGTAVRASSALKRLNELDEVVPLHAFVVEGEEAWDGTPWERSDRERLENILIDAIVNELIGDGEARDSLLSLGPAPGGR